MKNMVFKINGVDLSALCNQYGFSSGAVPIYSREVETMDYVRRSTIVRWRGWCDVPLNDITDDEARIFAGALRQEALSVEYYNASLNGQVTQDMTIDDGIGLEYLMQDVSGRYWSGKVLRFEER